MRLSPLDIKKHEFKRALRGYELEDVQAFLDMMAMQWEEMLSDLRRSEDRVLELQSKMEHYQKVEEALQEALQTARTNSAQTLENANQEAKLILLKAEADADELARAARKEAEELVSGAAKKHDSLEREVSSLLGRREEVVARLRAFLMSEVELLSRFEGDIVREGVSNPSPADAKSSRSAVKQSKSGKKRKRRKTPTAEHSLEPVADESIDFEGLDALLGEMTEEEAEELADALKEGPEDAASVSEADPVPSEMADVQAAAEFDTETIEVGTSEALTEQGNEDEALSFQFFEPISESAGGAFADDDSWLTHPEEEESNSSEQKLEEPVSEADEEIEKIRRILNDLG